MKSHKVTVVDYGMGNIWSVSSALKHLNCEVQVTSDSRLVAKAHAVVLPGVGSFNKAMHALRNLNLDESIVEVAHSQRVKLLGICLGMQLLGTSSTEDGFAKGLSLIPARVDQFTLQEVGFRKIPHVGFDQVQSAGESTLFKKLTGTDDFYFVHSYRMLPLELPGAQAICSYGVNFLAAYEHENIFATQFHPEKSQTNGLRLLQNFLEV
jgi:glutamine amidotransferase